MRIQKPQTKSTTHSSAHQTSNGKQEASITDNRPEAIAQRRLKTIMSNTSSTPIQCFSKSTLKDGLGSEFLEKHIASAGFPSLASRDDQENVIESVYYHRPKSDRRVMNTVFFANPATIESDLRNTISGDEVDYGNEYTTTNTYPAITVLRVYKEKDSEYAKAEIQHGPAKPVVKVNNGDGAPSFNHLQKTNPKTLGSKIDLL